MKKVMLIQPPFTQPKQSKKRCIQPIGLTYVAGYLLSKNIDVNILDCIVEGYYNETENNENITYGLSLENIKQKIIDEQPTHVGVSCMMSNQKHNTINVCKAIKEVDKTITIFIGGVHASICPNEMLLESSIDKVIVGEGEKSAYDAICSSNSILQSKQLDINTIPFPARKLTPMEDYFSINMHRNIFSKNKRVVNIVTSRGCPFKCIFCCVTNFHGNWRGRKPDNVIAEIEQLVREYDVQELDIQDENFIINRERVIEIAKGIRKYNIQWLNPSGTWINGLDEELIDVMYESGCYQLTLPVETTNKKLLHTLVNKPIDFDKLRNIVNHCKKIGMLTHAYFVCGHPDQTRHDSIKDFAFAMDVGFDSATYNILSPLQGSKLYEIYKNEIDVDNINFIKASIPHPEMQSNELEFLVKNLNHDFNKSLCWRNPEAFKNKYGYKKKESIFERQ
jgi:radical SAM superfamily enzyme YgiQ (UPF0313 family)